MRLIDADALINFIDSEHLRHPDDLSFSEVDVVNMLNHAPTAYDVDKVVEQLEDYRGDLRRFRCPSILTDIIYYVKVGGVDEK